MNMVPPVLTRAAPIRALCIAVAATLLWVAPAHATVLVLTDGTIAPQPYQSWIDGALVPTPPGEITLSLDGCPGDPPMPSCSPVNQGAIQLSPEWANRQVFLHEVGHVFDDLMPDWARGRFRAIVSARRGLVWASTRSRTPPNEQFAEAYSLCARRLSIRRRAFMGYGYDPTPAEHRRACAVINSVGGE
jgi:hypothetical protein